MKATIICLALTFAVGISLLTVHSQAAEMNATGEIEYKVLYHDETRLDDGRVVSRDHIRGTIKASDGSSPIDGSSHDCFGAAVFMPGGEQIAEGHGYCDGVDKDGDIWWLSWTAGSIGESEWTITGGTGKFAGMTGNGKTRFTLDEFKVANESTPSTLPSRYEGVLVLP